MNQSYIYWQHVSRRALFENAWAWACKGTANTSRLYAVRLLTGSASRHLRKHWRDESSGVEQAPEIVRQLSRQTTLRVRAAAPILPAD